MDDKILDLLADVCEDGAVRDNLDEDLFESGMMDSMTFAELIIALEDELGVVIAPSEVRREDVNTARKIVAMVKGRLQA